MAKTLEQVVSRVIESNKKLAESNEKHAKVMTGLTIALIVFAAVEAIATAVSVLIGASII